MAAPTISVQPLDRTAAAGASVALHLVAAGASDYQWVRVLNLADTPVPLVASALYQGVDGPTLTLPNFAAAQVGLYGCVVSNQEGTVGTRLVAVLLSGMVLPVVLTPPADLAVEHGGTAIFTVEIKDNAGPYTYGWLHDGQPLGNGAGPVSGADTASVSIAGVTAYTAGWYQCRIANATGAVLSASAGLSVTTGGQTVRPDPYPPAAAIVALKPPAGGVELGGSGGGTTTTTSGGAGSTGSGDVSFGLFANGLGTEGVDFKLDGDFRTARPLGLAIPSYPFLDQNNTNAVVFRQPYEQAVGSYAPLSMTQPQPDLGGLYYFGDANFKDGGAGVYGFDRLFGNIPAQRVRRGLSCNYPFQFLLTQGASITVGDTAGSIQSYTGPSYSIGTRVYPVNMIEVRDYFLAGQEDSVPLRRAPSYELTGQAIAPKGEDFNSPGNFPLALDSNGLVIGANGVTQILCEDDKYDEYRGAVRCRVRRIVAAPTQANFRNSGT